VRILHSSDWHLGIQAGTVSRAADHAIVLDWLVARLAQGDVDALVIAGDVFDSMQPSADAQAQYYGFLRRARDAGVRQIVVIGGNHDSASRLEAPRDLLGALSIHVVGGVGGDDDRAERGIVPLVGADGAVQAVLLAVPYVHEFRLGVRTTDLDRDAMRARFEERFTALYRDLADRAEAAFPGLPLLATGHLTVGAADRQDYPQEIHLVGQLEGLPPRVFDPRIRYVALGHIHRAYPVADGRAWYSGTPLALSLHEAAVPRRVLQVDLADDAVTVQPLIVPAPRSLRLLEGSRAEVLAAIVDQRWTEALPPLLHLRVRQDAPDPTLAQAVADALATHPAERRPAVVDLRTLQPAQPLEETAAAPDLQELGPRDVFLRLLQARGVVAHEPLLDAFDSLVSLPADDLQRRIDALEAP
jgi:DNA repair protein SbcD/Mre11